MRMNFCWAIFLLSATSAIACDKVDYVEAKDWTTARIEQAYCADLSENAARVIAKIEGKMDCAKSDMDLCSQQTALYKRLLEARKRPTPICKKPT